MANGAETQVFTFPDGNYGGGNIPFGALPYLNNNGGLFGGNGWGGGVLGFLFGLLCGNGGFGNGLFGGGNNGNNNVDLLMQAVNNSGERSVAAVQQLSSNIGQDFTLVNNAVQTLSQAVNQIANAQGLNSMQVINAIQSGDNVLQNALQQCCCNMQSAINAQTNTLQGVANANTQAILGKLGEMQTQSLVDKLDAARAENTRLAGEISQANQNNTIAAMISNAVNPLAAQLAGIRSEVDSIKRCQPATITLPNNSMTAVPTIWANAVADNIVDRISSALQSSGGDTTGGTGA